MLWLIIAIGAYLFLAIANIFDKFLLAKHLPHESVYAFYVGLFGIIILIVTPFGIIVPMGINILLNLIGGALFVGALLFLYKGLKNGETSVIAPLVGGTVPIWLLILSAIFVGERLTAQQIGAFIFLIAGFFLISYTKGFFTTKSTAQKKALQYAIFSGLLFALHYLIADYEYSALGFLSGFYWLRVGAFITALGFFLIPRYKKEIIKDFKQPKKAQAKSKGLMVGNQVIGAIGFVGLNYAISLSSPTLITAMQGLQYGFVFLLVIALGAQLPSIKEKLSKKIIIQKLFAILLIGIGIALLS